MNKARGFPIVLLGAEAETNSRATLVWSFSDNDGERLMSWRLTINIEDKARLWAAWYSSETPIGMYQLVSLRSMLSGPVPRSRSAWINPIPMKGTRFDDVVETKVIEADPGEGDLEEIAHRTDLHQRSDREVSIDLVVTT